MVVQYPHTGVINPGGLFPLTVIGRWRYTANKVIRDVNNQDVLVAGIFYTKDVLTDIPKSSTIKMTNTETGELIIAGAIKQISRGQLNTRIWI